MSSVICFLFFEFQRHKQDFLRRLPAAHHVQIAAREIPWPSAAKISSFLSSMFLSRYKPSYYSLLNIWVCRRQNGMTRLQCTLIMPGYFFQLPFPPTMPDPHTHTQTLLFTSCTKSLTDINQWCEILSNIYSSCPPFCLIDLWAVMMVKSLTSQGSIIGILTVRA